MPSLIESIATLTSGMEALDSRLAAMEEKRSTEMQQVLAALENLTKAVEGIQLTSEDPQPPPDTRTSKQPLFANPPLLDSPPKSTNTTATHHPHNSNIINADFSPDPHHQQGDNQSPRHLSTPRLEVPIFHGEAVEGWFFQLKRYFTRNHITPDQMGWFTRFFTAVTFLAIGIVFSPESFGSKSDGLPSPGLATYIKLAHLLSFATAWGSALWVTFIGGIIMFNNLPRHQFGNLQSKMFPAYFTLVGVCCAISVAAFAYLHPYKTASTVEKYQLGFLLSAFAFNLSNLLVFTPMTIEMMKQRHKIEREQNIGEEAGWSKNREAAKKNPKLAAMNKKFGMIHGLSSLANIMAFGSLALHSWYFASKIEM